MDITDGTLWTVMKWVLLVLAAGFIGQFGKALAEGIMRKIRTLRSEGRRYGEQPVSRYPSFSGGATAVGQGGDSLEADLRAEGNEAPLFYRGPPEAQQEKKLLKAMVKREKKLRKFKDRT